MPSPVSACSNSDLVPDPGSRSPRSLSPGARAFGASLLVQGARSGHDDELTSCDGLADQLGAFDRALDKAVPAGAGRIRQSGTWDVDGSRQHGDRQVLAATSSRWLPTSFSAHQHPARDRHHRPSDRGDRGRSCGPFHLREDSSGFEQERAFGFSELDPTARHDRTAWCHGRLPRRRWRGWLRIAPGSALEWLGSRAGARRLQRKSGVRRASWAGLFNLFLR
jgi:hypothetical protein